MATILVAGAKTKMMHFSHFLCIWHVFMQFHTCPESRHANGVHTFFHPTDPTCSNLDRRSLEVSVHLPGWDFAGGRVHTLPPGGALWDHHGPPGSLGSSYVSYSESSHVGLSPAAQNVLLHSRQ